MCPRNDKTWWQEPCYFTFVRAPTAINRNSRNNPKTMVSMTDHAMIFVRASERGKVPDNFSYPLEVQKYFEQSSSGAHEYGQMANLFLHYRPPTKSQRLKDNMGVMVRKCAERGVDQVEWLVTMFTKEGDLVMDMQCRTGTAEHQVDVYQWRSSRRAFSCAPFESAPTRRPSGPLPHQSSACSI